MIFSRCSEKSGIESDSYLCATIDRLDSHNRIEKRMKLKMKMWKSGNVEMWKTPNENLWQRGQRVGENVKSVGNASSSKSKSGKDQIPGLNQTKVPLYRRKLPKASVSTLGDLFLSLIFFSCITLSLVLVWSTCSVLASWLFNSYIFKLV